MVPIIQIFSLVSLLASTAFSTPVQSSGSTAAADNVYDYIVVGSGPGGGTVASNLARANYSVLLIEAGDSSSGAGSISSPAPQNTWDFFVKHHADEAKNKLFSHLTWRTPAGAYWVGRDNPPTGSTLLGIYYPRGATVGGSSMINAMCTWYPPDSDWDYIVKQTGDTSFNASAMRKIFERIEKNNYLPAGTPGHGFNGWFQTMLPQNTPALSGATLAVMNGFATAFGKNPSTMSSMVKSDPNFLDAKRDWTDGIWGLASHQRSNGQRYSSRDYITDTISQKFPLTLSITSLATRVLFSNSTQCGSKPKATGVEYLYGQSLYRADSRYKSSNKGELRTATARKEVIISGGTFNSPQLLMLSGIGDQAQLNQFGIPVLKHLPGVGTNMQDNEEMPIVGQSKGTATFAQGGYIMFTTKHSPDGERDVFLMQGSGFSFRGFWPSNQTNANLPNEVSGMYGVSMVKNHPQNTKGYVRLKSKDPQDMPDINFMHFSEGKETDMGAMKDTIAMVRKIYAGVAAPAGPITSLEPPCPAGPDKDGYCGQADEDWITAQTFGHHPTSTNPMGLENNTMSVVDNRFRVHGIAGLRVVDASVFPRIPGIFPVVATFMMGQKASDTLIEDAKAPDVCVYNAP